LHAWAIVSQSSATAAASNFGKRKNGPWPTPC
jgi:hypothetical protein